MTSSTIAAVAGLGLDQVLGEPPARWHPVAAYGTVMTRVEARLYADRRSVGVVHLAVGLGIGVSVGVVARRLVGPTAATALAAAVCSAGKMLDDEALRIQRLLAQGDLVGARTQLRSLVGRATDQLDEAGVARAVIESVAENSVDAVTASLWWAAVAGAPGVLAHRATNTLDAMVGHRNDRHRNYGWASARLDDAVNFVPARLSALAVAIARPRAAREVWRIVRRDAPQHPSPNGGVIEAAYAAALGVRLGGVNRYGDLVEDRGTLGDGIAPNASSITDAVRLRRRSTAVLCGLLLAGAAATRRGSRLLLRRTR